MHLKAVVEEAVGVDVEAVGMDVEVEVAGAVVEATVVDDLLQRTSPIFCTRSFWTVIVSLLICIDFIPDIILDFCTRPYLICSFVWQFPWFVLIVLDMYLCF